MNQKRSSKRPQSGQRLHTLFTAGGIAAVLLAANLIAGQDTEDVAPAPNVFQTSDNPYVESRPVPELVVPQPVARSRSSG